MYHRAKRMSLFDISPVLCLCPYPFKKIFRVLEVFFAERSIGADGWQRCWTRLRVE